MDWPSCVDVLDTSVVDNEVCTVVEDPGSSVSEVTVGWVVVDSGVSEPVDVGGFVVEAGGS